MIRYYQGCHTLKELRETQVKVTQGSFWSLREGFLTQRVATLYSIIIIKEYVEFIKLLKINFWTAC